MQAARQESDRKRDQQYTYNDYITWPEGEHWELIDGEAYPTYGPTAFSAPLLGHQGLALEIAALLRDYLRDKTCEVFISPVDVVFEESKYTKTVVQPDVVVVCDPEKTANGKKIIGAPDVAVEVLSPSTSVKDWTKKMRLYEQKGVREYWIISPTEKAVYQNILKNGEYEARTFIEGEMKSEVLEGFALSIEQLFVVP